MLFVRKILVRMLMLGMGVTTLVACGQQGPLYLPQTEGTNRATLPESLWPGLKAPAAATSSPTTADR